LSWSGVLPYGQIRPPILVEVSDGGAPLFTVNEYTATLSRNRNKAAAAVSLKHQTPASIESGGLRFRTKKILCDEEVLVTVAIEIGYRQPERWRELRFDRHWRRGECFAAV
jgi:hypothetical protein